MQRKQNCSMCGKCCLKLGHVLYMTVGDSRRWIHQGRDDILRYADLTLEHFGELWYDPETEEELDQCPFILKINSRKYVCAIQETKPKACKDFWCEWVYGAGERGIPFRTIRGWSQKARQLGYGK